MGLWGWPIAAVALGIAQGAIDEIMRIAQRKTPRLSRNMLREQSLFQTQLAQAVALVSSARAWLHAVVSKVWENTVRGEETALVERAEFLLAATNATRSSAAAVELAYTAGGGSAIWSAISTGAKHVCGPGFIGTLPKRASFRHPCS